MCIKGNKGIVLKRPKFLINEIEYFFAEDQGRYLIEIEPNNLNKVQNILNENNIFNEIVGKVQKDYFEVSGELKIKINELYKINNTWYNNY